MKKCKCGEDIPYSIIIDGVKRVLQNRTNCLTCVPYGTSRYTTKTEEGRLKRIAQKSKRYYDKYKSTNGVDKLTERRRKYKEYITRILGGSCQLCHYNKCRRNIVFHHLKDKKLSLNERSFQLSLETILPELKKCIMVCHNCHGEIHDNLIESDKLLNINTYNNGILSLLDNKPWSIIHNTPGFESC